MSEYDWTSNPETILTTKYGKVRAVWQSGRVFVNVASEEGQAHINDSRPALVYRGEEFIGSMHLDLGPAGFVADPGWVHLSRRSNWSDAPRTYREAMVAAVVDAVTTYVASVDPTIMDKGELAEIGQRMHGASRKLVEARQLVADLQAQMTALESRRAEITADLGL